MSGVGVSALMFQGKVGGLSLAWAAPVTEPYNWEPGFFWSEVKKEVERDADHITMSTGQRKYGYQVHVQGRRLLQLD